MAQLKELNDIDRCILANLDEAGEDYLSALLNTVFVCRGSEPEITAFAAALDRLISLRLVCLRESRESQEPHVFDSTETTQKLETLSSLVAWSPEELFWKQVKEGPRFSVLLTDKGIAQSKLILEQFGWAATEAIAEI